MNLDRLHFWYSERKFRQDMSRGRSSHNVALINGKEVIYTTCSEEKRHGESWPDLKYLGHGEYSHRGGMHTQGGKNKRNTIYFNNGVGGGGQLNWVVSRPTRRVPKPVNQRKARKARRTKQK